MAILLVKNQAPGVMLEVELSLLFHRTVYGIVSPRCGFVQQVVRLINYQELDHAAENVF